jgi:hypothetical protein
MKNSVILGALAALAWSGACAAGPAMQVEAVWRPDVPSRLTVKFRDELRVRAVGGRLVSAADAPLDEILAAAGAHNASFAPLINLPEGRLARIEQRAAAGSGRPQPDLAGMMAVEAPADQLDALAAALGGRPEVEWVWFAEITPPPPCEDIAPATLLYVDRQDYRGPNPGVNMLAAWDAGAGDGSGVRIADCEYGFIQHEDLCSIITEPGQTVHPTVASRGWDEHGTAVLGEMVALANGYGCEGLAPGAEAWFFTEWSVEQGSRRVTAIAAAVDAMEAGDVILLEMQTTGPGGGYGPAELDPAVWTLCRTATDAGIVVVGAAGNGSQDLDSASYANYRARGDSGAIIVGAGTSTTTHSALSFSTYGARVNVQGWGQNVFTLGYGSFIRVGGDRRQGYTASFSGTSSASPFIAACAASLQSTALARLGRPLTPEQARSILIRTGIAHTGPKHIGPFPDMVEATRAICRADVDLNGELDLFDFLEFQAMFAAGDAFADFDGDGELTFFDFLAFQEQFAAGC